VTVEPSATVTPVPPGTDQGLRRDIRALGTLLGETLVRQEGQELLELVEHVRTLMRTDRDAAAGVLALLDTTSATRLVRAFTTYFYLVNVAEQVHRGRELAAMRLKDGTWLQQAIDRIQAAGHTSADLEADLRHVNEPAHEMATAELLLQRGVPLVEASAYLDLTPAIVRYRVAGFRAGFGGMVIPMNRVIAKVSRVEVATKFLSPPPDRILKELVAAGHITASQAALAAKFPVADDITVEADSGGHTDNRPLTVLLPAIRALRDELVRRHGYARPVRVGAAGGLGDPAGVAAAFAAGAAYVVTGTVNQLAREAGLSAAAKDLLAKADFADVTMAPAADMFEMGVKLQVLKRGTMFPMRAQKLYDLYRQYPSWEAIPAAERVQVEKTHLRASFEQVWDETRAFWQGREPGQVAKAEADPRHKMALVFRWYLGLSSRWANAGEPTRQVDYQVWCGPAMGAFNEWAKGSVLEPPGGRTVVAVALNLLYGACVVLRRQALRQQGVNLADEHFPLAPMPRDEIENRLA